MSEQDEREAYNEDRMLHDEQFARECAGEDSMKRIPDERLKQMRERLEKATPGPHTPLWVPSGMPTACCHFGIVRPDGIEVVRLWERSDVEFYAHARLDMDRLLDERDTLAGIVEKLACCDIPEHERCRLCDAFISDDSKIELHKPNCPYRRAVEWQSGAAQEKVVE
jgi:hypothetical protein